MKGKTIFKRNNHTLASLFLWHLDIITRLPRIIAIGTALDAIAEFTGIWVRNVVRVAYHLFAYFLAYARLRWLLTMKKALVSKETLASIYCIGKSLNYFYLGQNCYNRSNSTLKQAALLIYYRSLLNALINIPEAHELLHNGLLVEALGGGVLINASFVVANTCVTHSCVDLRAASVSMFFNCLRPPPRTPHPFPFFHVHARSDWQSALQV